MPSDQRWDEASWPVKAIVVNAVVEAVHGYQKPLPCRRSIVIKTEKQQPHAIFDGAEQAR